MEGCESSYSTQSAAVSEGHSCSSEQSAGMEEQSVNNFSNMQGMMPNMQQGGIPNMQGMMPNMQPGGTSGMQGMMPNMQQGGVPNMQGMMPNMQQGGMPNMQGMMPNMQQGGMSGMQGMMPNMQPGGMPNMQGMMPNMQQGGMSGMQGMMPNMQPGGSFQYQGAGMAPHSPAHEGAPGIAPDGAGTHNAQSQKGTMPFGKYLGVITDVANGNPPDFSQVAQIVQETPGDFWKGLMVGAAVGLLATNETVRNSIMAVVAPLFGANNSETSKMEENDND